MAVTTRDIFGQAPDAEMATPGSYGEPPHGARLPEATRLGPVRLQVADLERSLAFYVDVLGLRIVERSAGGAALATQPAAGDGELPPHAAGPDRALVELVERAGARSVAHGGLLGLYHFAILVPDRASLGRFVQHVSSLRVRVGAGDHLVSEAFYLHDPDGLGIEVYADRPRSTWRRRGRELMLATDPVDVQGLLAAAGDVPWTGMPAGTVMGHVHLHVGDIATAASFYSDVIGFDRITWSYPGALFLGAGGYHHHVGTNTWAGPGATPPSADDAQLLEWTIELPDAAAVDAVAARLDAAGHTIGDAAPGEVLARDPWDTRVRLRIAR